MMSVEAFRPFVKNFGRCGRTALSSALDRAADQLLAKDRARNGFGEYPWLTESQINTDYRHETPVSPEIIDATDLSTVRARSKRKKAETS
jgi:hypothetical protein